MGESEVYLTSIQAVLNTRLGGEPPSRQEAAVQVRPECSNLVVLELPEMEAPTPAQVAHGLQIAPPTAFQAQAHLPPHPDGKQMVQGIQPLAQGKALQKESKPTVPIETWRQAPEEEGPTADLYSEIEDSEDTSPPHYKAW